MPGLVPEMTLEMSLGGRARPPQTHIQYVRGEGATPTQFFVNLQVSLSIDYLLESNDQFIGCQETGKKCACVCVCAGAGELLLRNVGAKRDAGVRQKHTTIKPNVLRRPILSIREQEHAKNINARCKLGDGKICTRRASTKTWLGLRKLALRWELREARFGHELLAHTHDLPDLI